MRDPYEQDREEMGVNERWAEDHGYSRGRCAVHGTFWTDSGDGCPSCDEHREIDDEEQEAWESNSEPQASELCNECGHHFHFHNHEYVCSCGCRAIAPMQDPDKWLQLTFAAWSVRMQRAARETTQGNFLMSAMHRNGVFHD